jgi:aerotaxis receptor
MKKNLPVTQREKTFHQESELVSATDTKGVITHANEDFVSISGFSLDELSGTSHNIVRHPDMPPAAFENLWDRLKKGKPWMGVVKNRCKDGDHYWVDAFVTPSFDGDELVGFESVRVRPEAKTVARAEAIYKKLWVGNARFGIPGFGIVQKLALGFSVVAAIGIFAGALVTESPITPFVLAWLITSVLGYAVAHFTLQGLRRLGIDAKEIVDNPVMQVVYTGRSDEVGNIEFALKTLRAQLRTVLGRIRESARMVSKESVDLNNTASEMSQSMQTQQHEIDIMAAAVEEMSASVHEVARSAVTASDATEQTNLRANAGKRSLEAAIAQTKLVADGVTQAANTIRSLEQESEAIDAVLVVIRGIAEQTNLLALNAAIEAARAGEQGRGFSVVADEVRTLASRTQASTAEIQTMIERLQGRAREAVRAMEHSHKQADESVQSTQQVGNELEDIFKQVTSLEEMGRGIATAAEQQSSVAQEVSRNIHRISEAAVNLAATGQSTREIGKSVAEQAADLDSLIRRFSR